MICAVCLFIFFYSEQNAVLPHHVHFFHVLIFYFRKQVVIWRMYGVLAGVFDNSLDHLDTWKRFAFSHYLPPMPSAIFQDGVTWCYPIRFPTVLTFVAWGLCCRGWVGEFGGGPRGRTLLVWELGLPPGWDSGMGGGCLPVFWVETVVIVLVGVVILVVVVLIVVAQLLALALVRVVLFSDNVQPRKTKMQSNT